MATAIGSGTVLSADGTRVFEFRLVGKNEKATSYMVGVDCIVLRRLRQANDRPRWESAQ